MLLNDNTIHKGNFGSTTSYPQLKCNYLRQDRWEFITGQVLYRCAIGSHQTADESDIQTGERVNRALAFFIGKLTCNVHKYPLHISMHLNALHLTAAEFTQMSKPDPMVHVRANVPGTMVHMVHIPEYGIFGQGQKHENAPRY